MAELDWLTAFPALARLGGDARDLLRRKARLVHLKPDTALFQPGDACQGFVMVLAGSIRVQMVSEGGHEIVLYRVGPGQTYILTTSCLMGRTEYSAEGLTKTALRAVMLPIAAFDRLVGESAALRSFVFTSFGTRISDLMALVSEVAFRRIDSRLAAALLHHAEPDSAVPLTHQALAVELGTAREVVSRQLKAFERRGLVWLDRGRLVIADPAGLRRLLAPDGD